MRGLAVVIHKTLEGTEVGVAIDALNPEDGRECFATRHPPGTRMSDALARILPIIRRREDEELRAMLNQTPKGSA